MRILFFRVNLYTETGKVEKKSILDITNTLIYSVANLSITKHGDLTSSAPNGPNPVLKLCKDWKCLNATIKLTLHISNTYHAIRITVTFFSLGVGCYS